MTVQSIKTGRRIEVAPGRHVADPEIPRDEVARYGFAKLMRQSDGSYIPVLQCWGETVRARESIWREMGIDVGSETIKRLIRAGFVRCRRIAPDTTLVDLQSLYEHLEAVRDPEFWTEARIQQYREGI